MCKLVIKPHNKLGMNNIMFKIKVLIVAGIATVGLSGAVSAVAASNEGSLVDSSGNSVRSNYAECWHDKNGTSATPGCEAAKPVLPTPVIMKEMRPVEPDVVRAPVSDPTPAPVPAANPAAVPASLSKEMPAAALTEHLVLIEGANFATDSAKLLKTSHMKLDEVVHAAKLHPEMKLEVSGHTDNRGKSVYNQNLSRSRAVAVKEYLVKHGVSKDRISTIGYGDAKPIADNKTEAGLNANRRVEVRYMLGK